MQFLRTVPWHRWSLPEMEGASSFLIALFAVIAVWIAFDRAPASIKFK
jgi:hypothetical protein